MTYRVEKENGVFLVIEKDTDQIVFDCGCENEARDYCRVLNLGSGFNGYTPSFFLQNFKQKERPSSED
jgi:hypothetical protein